jgi:hypothetical protein
VKAAFTRAVLVLVCAPWLCLAGCVQNDAARTELATRLATPDNEVDDQGRALPPRLHDEYITCGEMALSRIPAKRIGAALAASDTPGIWAVLGSKTLDRYVRLCRKVDQRRGAASAR